MSLNKNSQQSSNDKLASSTTKDQMLYQHTSELVVHDPAENRGPLKVLFLSADTGGGHRASAESLAKQFLIHYPGSSYDLLDIWTEDGVLPYRTLVNAYKHLSAHPRQWQLLYHLSNSRPWEVLTDLHSTYMCEKKIRKRIESYDPDVIVSVHPAMQYAPIISAREISKAKGKHIPFFTVVTDLGSAHCTWFQKNTEKMYVASERLRRLAKRRGRTPDDKIVMSGLPIRHDFAVEAEKLGDRTTKEGQEYQTRMKTHIGIDPQKPMVLLMGGGEGVGSLGEIVNDLYISFAERGIDATICVVCGRNEKLRKRIENMDWNAVLNRNEKPKKRLFGIIPRKTRKNDLTDTKLGHAGGKVDVIGLGFITHMAEYMVAADILVSKAGPGTIAEAASVGLPVMLTSFLPGQEAGNVNFVVDNNFGSFCKDPVSIANEVADWLQNPDHLHRMSRAAKDAGHPTAAEDIVLDIGSITHTWKALNKKS